MTAGSVPFPSGTSTPSVIGAARLQRLGSRALCEVLVELARSPVGIDGLVDLMGEIVHLPPEALQAAGGDRFPIHPLHVVE